MIPHNSIESILCTQILKMNGNHIYMHIGPGFMHQMNHRVGERS
jgi:hypothetical protein